MKVNLDRVDLVKEIPLHRPLSFVFETSSRCNFSCSFCPSSDHVLAKNVGFTRQDMTFDLFEKVVRDLQNFQDSIKIMHYHHMGEPLLNPNLPRMIRLAVDAKISSEHWIRTNGSLLTNDLIDQLVESGLTQIGISIEAINNEGYQKLVKQKDAFPKIYDGVSNLYKKSRGKCQIYVKIIDFGIPETDPNEFTKLFTPISDKIGIEYPRQWNGMISDTTLGQGVKLTVNGDPLCTRRISCPYPFFTMVVTSTGKCLMCCFDWSSQTIIGDANNESIIEIWNGQKVRDFWLMQLNGERYKNKACKDCLDIFTPPDDLDGAREVLVKQITKG
jgi:radical SAM protein with 4Fe4S-binding SPASM domain